MSPQSRLINTAGGGVRLVGSSGRRAASSTLDLVLVTLGGAVSNADRIRPLRRMILRVLPTAVEQLFQEQYADGVDATIELRILASTGGGERRFAMRIKDNQVHVTPGAAPDARAWFGGQLSDVIKVAAGVEPWMKMLGDGRFQLGGDPFTALRVPLLLGYAAPLEELLAR